jgi:leucyl-tRNA synthetase
VPRDAGQPEVEEEAFSEPNVKRHLESVQIKKIIYVPNKIINIIIAPR